MVGDRAQLALDAADDGEIAFEPFALVRIFCHRCLELFLGHIRRIEPGPGRFGAVVEERFVVIQTIPGAVHDSEKIQIGLILIFFQRLQELWILRIDLT
ncbi:MAG: hypothetical protein BWY83_02736 [bacterium ADurb.Bin478]|nr:MAG: hypothetical protein BWY83_02736 [bacterium ADurb.Bin478]